MRLGLSFTLDETSYPNPSQRLYGFVMELCEEAERLGLEHVWFSEHHEWGVGHLAQPLTFSAAVAARTSRIRVGTAVAVATLHHPAHLAEAATVVDLVSDGRFDFGVGAGYYVREFELFDADMSRRYDLLDEKVRAMRTLWAEERLKPLPVQNPLPIWVGFHGPTGAYRAGRLGEALLSCDANLWGRYRDGLLAGGHSPESGRMAGTISGWISEDPERDWELVGGLVQERFNGYRSRYVQGRNLPAPRPLDPERLRQSTMGEKLLGAFLLATPEAAAEKIHTFVGDAPVEEVHLDLPIGDLPEALIVDQVRLIATRLGPLLRHQAVAQPSESQVSA